MGDIAVKYKDGKELHLGMQWCFQEYNFERRHTGIEHDLPCNRYFSSKNTPVSFEGVLQEKYLRNFIDKTA